MSSIYELIAGSYQNVAIGPLEAGRAAPALSGKKDKICDLLNIGPHSSSSKPYRSSRFSPCSGLVWVGRWRRIGTV
jgi:hypothetical protein